MGLFSDLVKQAGSGLLMVTHSQDDGGKFMDRRVWLHNGKLSRNRMKPGFYWILKALLSHYWRHPWQTLFLCIGLVAGVGLWSAVQIINQHATASYQQAQNLLGAQANYWIRSRRDTRVSSSRSI